MMKMMMMINSNSIYLSILLYICYIGYMCMWFSLIIN